MNDGPGKVLVLLSGGLDSVTALYHARNSYDLAGGVSFDYGAKHHARELPLAGYHCKKLSLPHYKLQIEAVANHFRSALLAGGEAVPVGSYNPRIMRKTVVPFRNGIMLSLAAGLAESIGAGAILVAAHGGDHELYPDCRDKFMTAMAEAISSGTYARIALLRPFIRLDKAGIVRLGHQLGVDFSRTWSCYAGGRLHCGKCSTCIERQAAFVAAGIADPTVYQAVRPAT